MSTNLKSFEYQRHDDVMQAYAAGELSPAKSAILSQHLKVNPKAANDMAFDDCLSGTMLDDAESHELSSDFLKKALASLPKQTRDDAKTPETLLDKLDDIKWQTWVPGISTHDLIGDRKYGGDRLFLLKMRQGMGIWEHTHKGDEWVLVLTGAYEAQGVIHKAGDLHIEDHATSHALRAKAGEDCICLVMLDGPITMKSWLGKGLAKYMGL